MPNPASHDEPPSDLDSYLSWLKREHGVDVGDSLKTRYEVITAKLKTDFGASEFWSTVVSRLNDFDSAYRLQHDYPLFLDKNPPDIYSKPYRSFLLKTFRRNVIENTNWPEEPDGGWYLPDDSSYSKFNDLIRTSFVVKYLDGVSFLGERLAEICRDRDIAYELSFEARMEGHYAAHLCTSHEFEIPGHKWDTETIPLTVELQITTQLQEVIGKLLHKYYETRRVLPERERPDWQWAYESDEFIANYLGHILHYVEGMIMEVRTRQETKRGR
jgi:hypothetical protein